jgi:cation:H+ antiporter
MLFDIFLIATGIIFLYYGGDFLVTGSIRVAKQFKLSPFVIGATIVGFGTSAPELSVSIFASLKGSPEVALGNALGSNIANICLVLGLTALIKPIPINLELINKETPKFLFSAFLLLAFAWDRSLNRIEGTILIFLLGVFMWQTFSNNVSGEADLEEEEGLFADKGLPAQFGLILGGLILLVSGADWLVEGSVNIARLLGLSEWLIGISIVAIGTSLPEIVSSAIASSRGHGDLSIGNVYGSNIFNIHMVLGFASIIHPLNIKENIEPDLLIATGLTCMLVILFRFNSKLSKANGFFLLACYFSYILVKSLKLI